VVDGRHGDEDRIDIPGGDGLERIVEGRRPADLAGQPPGGIAVDVADRRDVDLGRGCCPSVRPR